MSRQRLRVAHTNVVAYLALFLVLASGSAYAARHYLITSTKQIRPSVRRALRGATGASGATGLRGVTGPAGPLLSALPAGATETGSFEADATATTLGDIAGASISFPTPLATAPTPNVVSSGSTSACPGSLTAPSAAPGELCIYEGSQADVAEINVYNPINNQAGASSAYGAGIVVDSGGSGNMYIGGTWAVTAAEP